jgi:hypothetical protein
MRRILWPHAGCGIAKVAGGGIVRAGAGEAVAGHVEVDGLRLSGSDLIGLMPDSNNAFGVSGALIEGLPGGEMVGVTSVGVGEEMIEATPILDERRSTRGEAGLGAEEAEGGVSVELLDHGRHGSEGGKPLTNGEQPVDADADKKDDEGAFDAGGVSAWKDGGHIEERISPQERGKEIEGEICDGC